MLGQRGHRQGNQAGCCRPVVFVSENHGFVTVCHGDDFVSSGSAAALDEVDRVLTAHFDTKILPRIGPTACGGEVTEGKHLGRTIRWSPQGFQWESNSKHVEDMVELCGLKLESKGAPTPITKATGMGRRDIDDGRLQVHPKPTFIPNVKISSQYHFHPKPLSSHDHFHQKNQFHPKTFSSKANFIPK